MDNLYEALRESHETQRKLCRQLVRIKPESPRALDVFNALRIELAAHAAAEERFLYAPILLDDMGLKSSRHALAEHHEIDECVEALAAARHRPKAWLECAKKLSHEVHHHLKEEESKFYIYYLASIALQKYLLEKGVDCAQLEIETAEELFFEYLARIDEFRESGI